MRRGGVFDQDRRVIGALLHTTNLRQSANLEVSRAMDYDAIRYPEQSEVTRIRCGGKKGKVKVERSRSGRGIPAPVKRALPVRVIHKLARKMDPKAPLLEPPEAWEGDVQQEPPIFVIGCQRSGTSLVRRILDSHSRIACPGESNFILPLAGMLQDKRSMQGLDSMGFERSKASASLAQFVDGFFRTYARAQGKPRWADKTPHYIDCLPQLAELFPRARFILILRHGLDVAYSLANPHWHYPAIDPFVAQANGDKPLGAGLYWVERSEKIESFYQVDPDRCHHIRYEDLTSEPEKSLQPLFDFIGEKWEPEVMQYDQFPHHSGYGDAEVRRHRKIRPNSQKYLEWPVDVQKAVRQVCTPMLMRLGYD